jgi:hypothetical protein
MSVALYGSRSIKASGCEAQARLPEHCVLLLICRHSASFEQAEFHGKPDLRGGLLPTKSDQTPPLPTPKHSHTTHPNTSAENPQSASYKHPQYTRTLHSVRSSSLSPSTMVCSPLSRPTFSCQNVTSEPRFSLRRRTLLTPLLAGRFTHRGASL